MSAETKWRGLAAEALSEDTAAAIGETVTYIRRDAHEAAIAEARKGPPCTCGSGGHPRECLAHPFAKELHCAELNLIAAQEEIEALRARVAKLEAANALVRAHIESLGEDVEAATSARENKGGQQVGSYPRLAMCPPSALIKLTRFVRDALAACEPKEGTT